VDQHLYVELTGNESPEGPVSSSIAIANDSDFVVTANLEAADLDGAIRASGRVDIPGNGQVSRFLDQVLPDLPASFKGVLHVTSAFPLAVSGLRSRYNERGDFLVSSTPHSGIAGSQQSFDLVFPHVVNGDGYSTQFLMLSNTPGTPVTGEMTLRQGNGKFLATLPVNGTAGVTLDSPLKAEPPVLALAASAAGVSSPYLYNFDHDGVLYEAGSMATSASPYWWVSSGGFLLLSEGRGSTGQGSLPSLHPWRLAYAASNPLDTDNGYHPQNTFRLPTRSRWQNARQEVYFVIRANNLSNSPNRNSSNGLLLFNRYQNSNNLYYTGVRVDGAAVIKKKQYGVYYTMAHNGGVYPGSYDRTTEPNLLPTDKWIGLRSEVVNLADGSVRIRLYIDKGWKGQWTLVAEAIDDGTQYGPPITAAGYGGIRTDFMDVMFENYRFRTIYP
jgi:hypothetical protein